MTASSVCTALTGNAPAAVSPASMIASAPSSTLLAASLTSARVGRGSTRIDSSTCVATIAGRPSDRADRMIAFCTRGTCSSGISRPRSPRATITPCASRRMASRFSIAAGRSILAMIGVARPASPMIARARATSSAVCTKLRATKSTPSLRPKRRSSTSLSVSADAGSATPGALMPLCAPSSPP